MKPEGVPADLVEKAARAVYAADPFLEHDDDGSMDPIAWDWLDNPDRQETLKAARHALAAVLPEYGARVLEEFAAEVRSWAPYDTRDIGAAFPADGVSERIEEHIARLTARDHCDGGCINPGSGDCPTCKAAATEELTDG